MQRVDAWRWRWRRRHDAAADVYARDGQLLVQPMNRTDGPWVAGEPVVVLEASTAPEALGAAVLAAVGSSRVVKYQVRPEGEAMRPLLEAAGVTSHRAFVENARLASVHRRRATWSFTSYRREGKAFIVDGEETSLERLDAVGIANAVRRALANSN